MLFTRSSSSRPSPKVVYQCRRLLSRATAAFLLTSGHDSTRTRHTQAKHEARSTRGWAHHRHHRRRGTLASFRFVSLLLMTGAPSRRGWRAGGLRIISLLPRGHAATRSLIPHLQPISPSHLVYSRTNFEARLKYSCPTAQIRSCTRH